MVKVTQTFFTVIVLSGMGSHSWHPFNWKSSMYHYLLDLPFNDRIATRSQMAVMGVMTYVNQPLLSGYI